MQLLRRCSASIDTIEKKVQVLTDEGTLEDFS
jgi:exonuclease VII small subunit